MNKRIGIIAGVVIIIIIVLTVVFSQENTNPTINTTVPTEPVAYITQAAVPTIAQTYQQFLSSGKSEICTFSASVNGGLTNGTIYAALGKIRGDISYSSDKGTYQQHLLIDAYETYMWNNSNNSGIKFTVTDRSPGDAINSLPNMNCSPWQPNTAVFDIPSNISFTEISDINIPSSTP